MQNLIHEPRFQEMLASLVRDVSPLEVYLIGSYARGTVHAGSDIDLIVIVPDDLLQRQSVLECWRKARYALRSLDIPVDILIYPQTAWLQWRHSQNHILGTCRQEGKLLYAA
jgi:predicted nucleotidyltransferase